MFSNLYYSFNHVQKSSPIRVPKSTFIQIRSCHLPEYPHASQNSRFQTDFLGIPFPVEPSTQSLRSNSRSQLKGALPVHVACL